jgi:hypothetical protein
VVVSPSYGLTKAPSTTEVLSKGNYIPGGDTAPTAPAEAVGPLDRSAINSRVRENPRSEPVPEVFGTRFPNADKLDIAAGALPAIPTWAGEEGPRWRVTVAPGCVAIGQVDLARRELTLEREQDAARKTADQVAQYRAEYVDDRAEGDPRAPITGWSRRSRSRLFRATGEIDYEPMIVLKEAPVMTTLTYADDWLAVCPTGKFTKKHVDIFWKRFARAWGVAFCGLWKLEFQRRGAPHYHLWHPRPIGLAGEVRRLTAVRYRPAVGDGLPYDEWVRVVWADTVRHPDPSDRAKHEIHGAVVSEVEEGHVNTPMKLAGYFAKHGAFMAKDYQNKVPREWRAPGKGPGRFWGYKGLERVTRAVDVSPTDAQRMARILRRKAARERYWNAAAGKYCWRKAMREARVQRGERVDRSTGECTPRFRKVVRPATRFKGGAGFLCVDDGPMTAINLARAAEIWRAADPGDVRWGRQLERIEDERVRLAATRV